eukprot:UN19029
MPLPISLVQSVKTLMPNAHFLHGYGMAETAGPCVYHHTSPTGDLYRSGKGVSPITKSFPGMEMKICANNDR